MFRARALCPWAVVIPPDMEKYARVGRAVRSLMHELTPLVEPLSIDEAFLDLSGTERLHGLSPARTLAKFAKRVEAEIGITVSIGLSANKYLAKIASDLDKPRGFAVLGLGEAQAFLAPRPLSFIFGVGEATQARLARDGYRTLADLQQASDDELLRRYGGEGVRLAQLARGIDARPVCPHREAKSVSAETTFEEDVSAFSTLERRLWRLCERLSARLKAAGLRGSTVTLKLKGADFRIRTRARGIGAPTALAGRIFAAGRELLRREADGTRFRLIGIGVSELSHGPDDECVDLVERSGRREAAAEQAVDRVRAKFGRHAIVKGLEFVPED